MTAGSHNVSAECIRGAVVECIIACLRKRWLVDVVFDVLGDVRYPPITLLATSHCGAVSSGLNQSKCARCTRIEAALVEITLNKM